MILVAVVAGAVAVALFSVVLLPAPPNRETRTLRLYTGDVARRRRGGSLDGVRALALGVVERVPKPDGYDERLNARLDRAAWPLRAGEFVALRAGAAVGSAALFGTLTASVPLGLLVAVGAWIAPRMVLDMRIDKRGRDFLAQLPDTLQMMAASLEAGYGLLQAMDTIVHESPAPTSEEFARALAEIRLGMPAHEALIGAADRVGGDDFRWVVMAMNIQREVGGNLAALLKTVAQTLREREGLRRTVKVLSAEGRLSAWVLGLLPIGLAVYMAVVNPDYIGTLFTTGVGRAMLGFSLVSMALGAAWMSRLVRIKV